VNRTFALLIAALTAAVAACGASAAETGTLRVHNIFGSNMVIQRDTPIRVWGWATPGRKVAVQFGQAKADADAAARTGRWEVVFPARPADANAQKLTVTAGDDKIEMDNILVGDVWVMNGQSNMAFGLKGTLDADLEAATADLPLLRQVRISPNEWETLLEDISADKIDGWKACTPETAGGISAIGYAFASQVQRATGIPIGIIDNARGGASIESLVPLQMFRKDPLAEKYLESVEKRQAEFDWDAAVKALTDKWEKDVAEQRKKGVVEDKLPPKPTRNDLRSWNVPGRSPSDAAACYNGMFGAFKGLNIKGVLFHQGYNNAIGSNCRPKRYRVLMRLMVDGWREDFADPNLPVGVIGFCAGSISQTRDNFEIWSDSTGAYIREAQRLGLADVKDPANTAFLPAYDVQIPGLHPQKQREHGVRAARWALNKVYGMKINWDSASLVSAVPEGDCMVLTFDKPVMPDDMSTIPEGFSIAGKDGKYYLGHARFLLKKDAGVWNTANKSYDATKVYVWSPLVKQPTAVRYGWATSPMGNLKVSGKPWLPLQSFCTDSWDWPESDDPTVSAVDRAKGREMQQDAAERLEFRKIEEARQAVEILKRLETLGRSAAKGG